MHYIDILEMKYFSSFPRHINGIIFEPFHFFLTFSRGTMSRAEMHLTFRLTSESARKLRTFL